MPDTAASRAPSIRELISADAIAARVEDLAREIVADPVLEALTQPATDRGRVALCALQGGFIFGADLLRAMSRLGCDPELAFVQLASYGEETVSSGAVTLVRDLTAEVEGRPVLFIDDILDSGRTLNYAINHLNARGAKVVRSAVLLDKKERRALTIEADYSGFACPDVFVVGYGMDAAGRYRGLPYVGVVEG